MGAVTKYRVGLVELGQFSWGWLGCDKISSWGWLDCDKILNWVCLGCVKILSWVCLGCDKILRPLDSPARVWHCSLKPGCGIALLSQVVALLSKVRCGTVL